MLPYAPDVNHMENTEPGVSYEETNKLSDHLQTASFTRLSFSQCREYRDLKTWLRNTQLELGIFGGHVHMSRGPSNVV